jgi:uncharacterized membrane protein YozB (DUF420 family)
MTFGAIGFVGSIIISLIVLFSTYSKVGDSGFGHSCTGSCANLTWQTVVSHITLVLSYLSIAAIVIGVLMIIAVNAKAKKVQQPLPAQPQPYNPTNPMQATVAMPVPTAAAQPRNMKHLVIRILASIAAFFISTSIVITVIADSVMKASSKTTNQQGHIFAYIIIFAYPLAGGFSAYFTNKYLKKRFGD